MFGRVTTSDPLDVTIAKLSLLLSVLLFGLRFLANEELLVIVPGAIALASAGYLFVGTDRRRAFEFPLTTGRIVGYLPVAVVLVLAIFVLRTGLEGGRAAPSIALYAVLGTLILVQILLVDEDGLSPGVILGELFLVAVVVRLTTLFLTPGFIGVDIWTHVPVFVDGIVEAESLSAISQSKYSMAPLYHAIGAIGTLVFGTPRAGIYLTVGLLVPLAGLFVYGTAVTFVPARWALLATALFVLADEVFRWGLHVIPTSLGLVFFLGALYALTKLLVAEERWALLLLVTASLATVFTHQVSTAIVLVLLGTASIVVLLAPIFADHDKPSRKTAAGVVGTFLLTLVVTAVSWVNTPWYGEDPFLWEIVGTLQTVLLTEAGFLNLAGSAGGGSGAAETATLAGQVVPYVEWLGFAILLAAAVIGGLATLRMEAPTVARWTYVFAAGLLFVIVFGFSIFGIRAILPGRWIGFMYAPFAILGAVGLSYLARSSSRRVVLAVFLILALGYPGTMAVADKATLDSPAFPEEQLRYAYSETELAGVETITSIYPATAAERVMASDHPYKTVYGRYGGYTGQVIALPETGPPVQSPVVIRNYQTSGPALFETAGSEPQVISSPGVDPARVCPADWNHVYTNEEVTMCTRPTGDTEGSE